MGQSQALPELSQDCLQLAQRSLNFLGKVASSFLQGITSSLTKDWWRLTRASLSYIKSVLNPLKGPSMPLVEMTQVSLGVFPQASKKVWGQSQTHLSYPEITQGPLNVPQCPFQVGLSKVFSRDFFFVLTKIEGQPRAPLSYCRFTLSSIRSSSKLIGDKTLLGLQPRLRVASNTQELTHTLPKPPRISL